jgi:hypothetical protein
MIGRFSNRIRLLILFLSLAGGRTLRADGECPVPLIMEEQTRWCWAAADHMIRASLGEPWWQCADAYNAATVGNLRGVTAGTNCCDPARASGVCNTTCWPQISRYNLCSIRDASLSWNEVTQYLAGGSHCFPFIFAYTFPGGATHYRVAVGYQGTSESNGYVHFNDPSPLMQGGVYISYADFSTNTTGVWYNINP